MASKISLINRAIALIGGDVITSLDDDTTESNTAVEIYPMVIEDLLSRYRWRFAHVQIQLPRLTAEPDARWSAAYQIPSDCLQVETVTVNDIPIRYDQLEDKIVCDASSSDEVFLEYEIKNDETKWKGYFQTLVVFQLASLMAIPVGDRNDLAEMYEKRALRHFSLAKNLDAQGITTKRIPTGRIKRNRMGR